MLRYFIALLVLFYTSVCSAQTYLERPDWAEYFRTKGVVGTIAVYDQRSNSYLAHDIHRASQRFVPASTFKIPHTLFALDSGKIADEFQSFKWDGVTSRFPVWNKDQTTRTAFRNSVVWVYQDLARKLGYEQEQKYLQLVDYGNNLASGGIDQFWLKGNLKISATEQIAFLRKLYENKLPFREKDLLLVKDLMVYDARPNWILRAKSGWAFDIEPQTGWFVGWLELDSQPIFFALNITMPNRDKDTAKRAQIVREVLKSLGDLPPN